MKKKKQEENNKKIAFIVGGVVVFVLLLLLLLKGCNKETFTITFDSNGGSTIPPVTVKKEDTIPRPNDPVREGYIFTGWYYEKELFDFTTKVKKDMKLVAHWTKEGQIELEKIELENTTYSLSVGESITLEVIYTPSDAKEELVWTSSDESIATIENGVVKALKEGTVTITVKTKDGKLSASCTITVTKKEETSKNPTTPNTPSTQTKPSTPSNPSSPNTPSNPSKPSDSTVSETGVTIKGDKQEIVVKESLQLTAVVSPDNATNKSVAWKSSDPSVATVDANGKVVGVGAGTVTITVTTSNGKTATYEITVKDVYVIYLTQRKLEVAGGAIQYDFKVEKNGVVFTDYLGFTYNDTPVSKGQGSVSSTVVSKGGNTASLKLSNGTVVTATVQTN